MSDPRAANEGGDALADLMSQFPPAWGGAPGRGRLRERAEDFQVTEHLGFEPDGQGEHLLIQLRKRDCNTDWVARRLARLAGVRPSEVGFCGLKDRRAVAVQWFSLQRPAVAEPALRQALAAEPDLQMLRMDWHGRKLRRGSHAGNGFRLCLRGLEGDRGALEGVLAALCSRGFPNYFGPQRFGSRLRNLQLGLAWLGGGRAPPGRQQRGLALSALRSLLFNRVLARRITDGTWLQVLPEDLLNLDGSGSWFRAAAQDADLQARVAAGDLHPTGPLWGRHRRGSALAWEREREWLAGEAAALTGLEAHGVEAARRPLRVVPRGLQWRFEGEALVLEFDLPGGAYATSLVRELIGDQGEERNA